MKSAPEDSGAVVVSQQSVQEVHECFHLGLDSFPAHIFKLSLIFIFTLFVLAAAHRPPSVASRSPRCLVAVFLLRKSGAHFRQTRCVHVIRTREERGRKPGRGAAGWGSAP